MAVAAGKARKSATKDLFNLHEHSRISYTRRTCSGSKRGRTRRTWRRRNNNETKEAPGESHRLVVIIYWPCSGSEYPDEWAREALVATTATAIKGKLGAQQQRRRRRNKERKKGSQWSVAINKQTNKQHIHSWTGTGEGGGEPKDDARQSMSGPCRTSRSSSSRGTTTTTANGDNISTNGLTNGFGMEKFRKRGRDGKKAVNSTNSIRERSILSVQQQEQHRPRYMMAQDECELSSEIY